MVAKLIAKAEILNTPEDLDTILTDLEYSGRTCYKSEENITPDSAAEFCAKLLRLGHESVFEHRSVTVRLVCDRGVSHEIVRHRIASYSQESTRYCNYANDKFDSQISVIRIDPGMLVEGKRTDESEEFWQIMDIWASAMQYAEEAYMKMLNAGASPQIARSVLPDSLKTELVMTANIREWREIFRQRTSKKAHPQMREIMKPLLNDFQQAIPILFDDII